VVRPISNTRQNGAKLPQILPHPSPSPHLLYTPHHSTPRQLTGVETDAWRGREISGRRAKSRDTHIISIITELVVRRLSAATVQQMSAGEPASWGQVGRTTSHRILSPRRLSTEYQCSSTQRRTRDGTLPCERALIEFDDQPKRSTSDTLIFPVSRASVAQDAKENQSASNFTNTGDVTRRHVARPRTSFQKRRINKWFFYSLRGSSRPAHRPGIRARSPRRGW